MQVEVWADVVCPFCYIGKRSLDLALEQFEHRDQVEVIWRSFQLDPDSARPAAANVHQLIADKYGISLDAARKKHEDLAEQGAQLGLEYRFDQAIPTNTRDAHRLIHLATRHGLQSQMSERLFAAYFSEGVDIADHTALAVLADEVGLDKSDAERVLAEDQFGSAVEQDSAIGVQLGLNGVPFFVLDRVAGLAGAQPPAVLLEALNLVFAQSEGQESVPTAADGDDLVSESR